jgi:serine kinase of HPr protein (carbohydrate metabolism regulator)
METRVEHNFISLTSLTDLISLTDLTYLNRNIDKCAIICTAYDIAGILHKILKGYFRYIGKNQWQYYENKQWQLDKKHRQLRNFIQTYVSDLFVKRYLYIFEHKDAYPDYICLSTNMLKVSYQLKTKQFISTVIKEARGFFDYHNDD